MSFLKKRVFAAVGKTLSWTKLTSCLINRHKPWVLINLVLINSPQWDIDFCLLERQPLESLFLSATHTVTQSFCLFTLRFCFPPPTWAGSSQTNDNWANGIKSLCGSRSRRLNRCAESWKHSQPKLCFLWKCLVSERELQGKEDNERLHLN